MHSLLMPGPDLHWVCKCIGTAQLRPDQGGALLVQQLHAALPLWRPQHGLLTHCLTASVLWVWQEQGLIYLACLNPVLVYSRASPKQHGRWTVGAKFMG